MSKKKTETTITEKPSARPPGLPSDFIRPTAEYEEEIEVTLTPSQIAEHRKIITDLLIRKNEIEAEADAKKKEYGRARDSVDMSINQSLGLVQKKVQREKRVVQEWLTKGNEIVIIIKETGQVVGNARTANQEELQEPLFTTEQVKPDPDGQPPPDNFPDFGGGAPVK